MKFPIFKMTNPRPMKFALGGGIEGIDPIRLRQYQNLWNGLADHQKAEYNKLYGNDLT